MLTPGGWCQNLGHPADVSENCLVWEKPTCLDLEVFLCMSKEETGHCFPKLTLPQFPHV